ncbi:hypothetical protein Tco_0335167 [Tanacetum coccineum]
MYGKSETMDCKIWCPSKILGPVHWPSLHMPKTGPGFEAGKDYLLGRRTSGGRKETAKKYEPEEQERVNKPKISSKAEVEEKCDDGSHIEEQLPYISALCREWEQWRRR